MRILIIMEGFFPGKKYGGPPVSVDNFCTLMNDDECFILATDHDLNDSTRYESISEGWNTRANCKVMYVPDKEYRKATFEKLLINLKPDLLYLQGLFQSCIIPCLYAAKKLRINVLLAPRGELCPGAINMKKYKKIPYIYAVRLLGLTQGIHFQSTSEDEHEGIIKWLKVENNRIHDLTNIPSLPKESLKRNVKRSGSVRMVFLSRVHPKKNLLAVIRYLSHVNGKASLDIYGPIEDQEYWKECQSEIAKLQPNIKVEYKGLISHDEVHRTFSKYDAFIFPTLSENYGHVIIESLIVGTPVIISDGTPWTDVNSYHAGWAYNLNEEAKFVETINYLIQIDNDDMKHYSSNSEQYAKLKMNLDKLKQEYSFCLKSIAGNM